MILSWGNQSSRIFSPYGHLCENWDHLCQHNLTFPFKNSYPGRSNCKPMITSLFASGYSCTPTYPGKHCAYLGKLLNKQDNGFLTWIKCILIRTLISSSRLALRPLPCVHWYKTTMSQTSSSPNNQCPEPQSPSLMKILQFLSSLGMLLGLY